MKKIFFVFSFIIFFSSCKEEIPDIFVTQHNLSSSITFDFTKDYSVKAGTVTFLNKEDKYKKWRYIYHAPLACLYNKKTKKCDEKMGESIVSNNLDSEEADSILLGLLDSATFYTPVKPYGSVSADIYFNLNVYPQPRELIKHIAKNHKDLEYHIFIRSGAVIYPDMSGTPDFIVRLD